MRYDFFLCNAFLLFFFDNPQAFGTKAKATSNTRLFYFEVMQVWVASFFSSDVAVGDIHPNLQTFSALVTNTHKMFLYKKYVTEIITHLMDGILLIVMINLGTGDYVSTFFQVLTLLLIVALVISVHEASHAYFANRLGDPTARLLGRMTINPIAHIDPIGTLVVPLVLYFLSGFVFGWAKPTPINPLNFANPRRDSAIVAFAGPASNFALAIVFSILFRVFPPGIFSDILIILVSINLLLGIFNLIPIPPLDGYKVLLGIMPKEIALRLAVLENYGPIVLIIFLLFFISFLSPIVFALLSFLLKIFTGASF